MSDRNFRDGNHIPMGGVPVPLLGGKIPEIAGYHIHIPGPEEDARTIDIEGKVNGAPAVKCFTWGGKSRRFATARMFAAALMTGTARPDEWTDCEVEEIIDAALLLADRLEARIHADEEKAKEQAKNADGA